jgi:hypothetical protein
MDLVNLPSTNAVEIKNIPLNRTLYTSLAFFFVHVGSHSGRFGNVVAAFLGSFDDGGRHLVVCPFLRQKSTVLRR